MLSSFSLVQVTEKKIPVFHSVMMEEARKVDRETYIRLLNRLLERGCIPAEFLKQARQ